ncbi:MAG TPA: hypothetical protein VF331_13360, partial [Polyangiales bacterium]
MRPVQIASCALLMAAWGCSAGRHAAEAVRDAGRDAARGDAAAVLAVPDGGAMLADAASSTSQGGSSDAGPAPVCAPGCASACPQGCFDLGACKSAGTGSLALHPNVFTLGVVLTMAAAPSEAELFYR